MSKLTCWVNVTVLSGMVMHVRCDHQHCTNHNTITVYLSALTSDDDQSHLAPTSYWTGCEGPYDPMPDVFTPSNDVSIAFVVSDLSEVYEASVTVTVVPHNSEQELQTWWLSSRMVIVQTAGWRPHDSRRNVAVARKTQLTLSLPSTSEGHTYVMVSFPNIHTRKHISVKRSCYFCKEYVVIAQGNLPPPPVLFFSRREVTVSYRSNLFSTKDRFRILATVHTEPNVPKQSKSNGKWNCSVPFWPAFMHHMQCNLRVECEGGEDEEGCPYDLCGGGGGGSTGVNVLGSCFLLDTVGGDRYFDAFADSTHTKDFAMTHRQAEERCQQFGGVLANLKTLELFRAVVSLLTQQIHGPHQLFVGLRSSVYGLPFPYKHAQGVEWADGTQTLYPPRILSHNRPRCALLTLFRSHVYYDGDSADNIFLMTNCTEKHSAYNLCELPHLSKPGTVPPHHVALHAPTPETSDTLITCPGGHVVHSFLACDVASACWARHDVGYDDERFALPDVRSCPAPMTLLPPMFACGVGGQRVPYSVVCDHRQHCLDNSDEHFCVFPPCSHTTPLQCGNRKQCHSREERCDGQDFCEDGGDEIFCLKSDYHETKFANLPPPAVVLHDKRGTPQFFPLDYFAQIGKTDVTTRHPTSAHTADSSDFSVKNYWEKLREMNVRRFNPTENFTDIRITENLSRGYTSVRENVIHVTGVPTSQRLPERLPQSLRCPESHFQCGGGGYCLPVYLRCNQVYDCPDWEDEAECEVYLCPGFYFCRFSTVCVHLTHLCDSIFQCPQRDDELLCHLVCPPVCTCHGFAFTCTRVFQVSRHPQLRYLDGRGSGLTLGGLSANGLLVHVSLADCGLSDLTPLTLPILHSMDLSDNHLHSLHAHHLTTLPSLTRLVLANNPLTHIFQHQASEETVANMTSMRHLTLSHVRIAVLTPDLLSHFPRLTSLNLSGCGVQQVLMRTLATLTRLRVLDLRGNPVTSFARDLFQGQWDLQLVLSDNYKVCCAQVLPVESFTTCHAPVDEVSSCDALLGSDVYRVMLTLFAVLALCGNALSLVCRTKSQLKSQKKTGHLVFVTHLCLADFVMGVYLAMIGVADRVYYSTYLWEDEGWRHSVTCQLAGCLGLLSSEVSAFIICFITLDRFLVLRFPFSPLHFHSYSAHWSCLLVWFVGICLAVFPIMPPSSQWQFYSQNGICIPLPITRADFAGHGYAFGVMIVVNFVLFLLIAAGQSAIYFSIRSNSLTDVSSGRESQDTTIALRLISITLSDFACWVPVGLLGLMASQGVAVPGQVNVAMAILVLPLNSVLNPFLYTINCLLQRRRQAKEDQLIQYLQCLEE